MAKKRSAGAHKHQFSPHVTWILNRLMDEKLPAESQCRYKSALILLKELRENPALKKWFLRQCIRGLFEDAWKEAREPKRAKPEVEEDVPEEEPRDSVMNMLEELKRQREEKAASA